MQKSLLVAFVLCVIIASLPLTVKLLEKASPEESPPIPDNGSTSANGVYYVGYLTSHQGEDMLCVVPAEAYVPEGGSIVTINVTVKFRHAQPCKYSDWKILAENSNNVEVIGETKTELKDPYTAVKQYTVKVLGEGSLDVVFKYGTGCPYGTEERVTVKFHIGEPSGEVLSQNQTTPSLNLTEETNVTELNITGVIEEVNYDEKYIVVKSPSNTTEVYITGKWFDENGNELRWRDMLALLKSGENVEIVAAYEDGLWKAHEIVLNGKRYVKG